MGSFGSVVRFNAGNLDFSHPWAADLVDKTGVTLLPGSINTIPAKIKGVPLGGTDQKAVPQLSWGDKPLLTADGIGYICAEVTCDPKADWSVTAIEIVQVADPNSEDGKPGVISNASGAAFPLSKNRARWPLAMLQQRKGGQIELFQVTFFNLTHRVKLKTDGVSASRHFFWC